MGDEVLTLGLYISGISCPLDNQVQIYVSIPASERKIDIKYAIVENLSKKSKCSNIELLLAGTCRGHWTQTKKNVTRERL